MKRHSIQEKILTILQDALWNHIGKPVRKNKLIEKSMNQNAPIYFNPNNIWVAIGALSLLQAQGYILYYSFVYFLKSEHQLFIVGGLTVFFVTTWFQSHILVRISSYWKNFDPNLLTLPPLKISVEAIVEWTKCIIAFGAAALFVSFLLGHYPYPADVDYRVMLIHFAVYWGISTILASRQDIRMTATYDPTAIALSFTTGVLFIGIGLATNEFIFYTFGLIGSSVVCIQTAIFLIGTFKIDTREFYKK